MTDTMAEIDGKDKRQLSLVGLSLLSVAIGVITGLGAILLRYLMGLIHNLFFLGELSGSYDANMPTPASPFGAGIILAPVIGGLIVLFMVRRFAPEAKGHGVPEVMDAIYYDGGRIRPVVVVVKSLASAISIGSGASVGREGPIIQIGSGIGSVLGQYAHLRSWQRITMVAAGAGAGIAATFNTPLGGLMFAIELMLPEFSARTLLPVVLATGTATYVGRLAFGIEPAFLVAAHERPDLFVPLSADMLPLYVFFGLLVGLAAALFVRTLYATEDLFESIPLNPYLKTVIGMGALGVLLYVLVRTTGQYHTAGVGYATIQQILTGQISAPLFLLLLFALKLVATSTSLAAGASGGVFSPSLFLGASLGAAFGAGLDAAFPYLGFNTVTFALIGMAGVVGAGTSAVMTAIIMIFEMTGDYTILVPSVIAVACAVGIRRAVMADDIYTMKLTRRGHHIPRESRSHMFPLRLARDVMEPVITVIEHDDLKPAGKVSPRASGKRCFAVVTRGRHIEGVTAVDRYAPDQALGPILQPVGIVREGSFLQAAIRHMADRRHRALLVVPQGSTPRPENVTGVITRVMIAESVLSDYQS